MWRKVVTAVPSLVLGSGSPRRKQLLELAGYDFSIRTSEVDESLEPGMRPEEAVVYLAEKKGEALERKHGEVLLTADTVVADQGEILGKPRNEEEARRYLRQLSGGTHQVYTGVCLRGEDGCRSFFISTSVTFLKLSPEDVEWYIRTGEWLDKAGGYGIQGKGSLLVEKLEGDFYNVVGLPIARVVRALEQLGIRRP
ncbi:UNVERIFIED_CONTAM: Maf family protein [Halobacillus marinus]